MGRRYDPAEDRRDIVRIDLKTSGVAHLALRVTDYGRAKRFYLETLGFPLLMETENLFIFSAGATAIGVRGPDAKTPKADRFSPFRVGLDHLALGCEQDAELQRVARALAEAGITNTGVKLDPTLNKRYVAFKDPDGISWEFYSV
jgi:glyoxylase I family protein